MWLYTQNMLAAWDPVRHVVAVSQSEQLSMSPNDAEGERRSKQCIYHCQIELWRLWWDAEPLHNAYVVFVMS